MRLSLDFLKTIRHYKYVLAAKIYNRYPRLISDKLFVQSEFYFRMGYELDLKHPKTFNEKLNWLKLYDHNPLYTTLVDKVKVKDWVANKIGKEYIIPTLDVWDNPKEIDFDKLPNKFVLKCNHNSGIGLYICKNKQLADIQQIIQGGVEGLKENFYLRFREWPYKNVQRKYFAEQYMEEENSADLKDYKFFCFNGSPKIMYISNDHSTTPTTDFYDMDFNRIKMRMRDPNSNSNVEKPMMFEKMKEIVSLLSKGIPHVRVDLYLIKGQIYFGEMTFYHNAGYQPVYPQEWNERMGDMIDLSLVH